MKKLLSLILTLAMLCTMCIAFGITASAEAPSGDFVTFSSQSSFTITAPKKWDGTLYYSTNGTSWAEYAGGTALTAEQIGGTGDYYLCFRGEGNSIISHGYRWTIVGSDVSCNGNIENLRDYTGTVPMGSSCYYNMFSKCTSLVEVPELPATTLADYCYYSMFYGCTSLTEAPALPAKNLTDYCYSRMFDACTSLVEAPSLPAMNLAEYCYDSMFYNCTSLTEAPALPATTLAVYCYTRMFDCCTSLTEAPALPAKNLTDYCYSSMFDDCTALTTAPVLPSENLADFCYNSMFSDCTALTTAPALPSENLADFCYNSMFSGCTSLREAPALPATNLADFCYNSMFSDCTALTTAPALPSENLADFCYNSMFYGCTSLREAPALPATNLAIYCYQYMFSGCTALDTPPELPIANLADSCYDGMFTDCTAIKLYESESDAGSAPLEWSIPAETNENGASAWNAYMFLRTGGSFKGTPEIGKTYYYPNPSLSPKTHDVAITYQSGAAAGTVYSVEIAWGSMEFAYTDAREGTWNPTTLQYEGASAAGWTCEADANKIIVTNRSNTAVNAVLSFAGSIDGIDGGFYDAATGGNAIAGNTFALASAAPAGEATTGTEQTGTAYIQIASGALTSGQTDVKIGTVTVTISDAE